MDEQALFKITYGLYVVSASFDGEDSGCIVNTLQQVTNTPNMLAVTISKNNYTCGLIEKSGFFGGVALNREADMALIGRFGFKSGKDIKKFADIRFARDEAGVPYILQAVSARYTCKVVKQLDLDTHILFVGEVTEGEVLSEGEPLTYTYYRDVIKGGTPKNAPSYHARPPKETAVATSALKKKYRCKICGFTHEGDSLPADYVCPICGATGEQFQSL